MNILCSMQNIKDSQREIFHCLKSSSYLLVPKVLTIFLILLNFLKKFHNEVNDKYFVKNDAPKNCIFKYCKKKLLKHEPLEEETENMSDICKSF